MLRLGAFLTDRGLPHKLVAQVNAINATADAVAAVRQAAARTLPPLSPANAVKMHLRGSDARGSIDRPPPRAERRSGSGVASIVVPDGADASARNPPTPATPAAAAGFPARASAASGSQSPKEAAGTLQGEQDGGLAGSRSGVSPEFALEAEERIRSCRQAWAHAPLPPKHWTACERLWSLRCCRCQLPMRKAPAMVIINARP